MPFAEGFIPHFVRCIVVKISEFIQLSRWAVFVFHSVMHIDVENFYQMLIQLRESVAILTTANKFGRPPNELRAASRTCVAKIFCDTMTHSRGLSKW
jgi:hypothetical protein